MRALGIHVFAGGFTMGVQEVAEVVAQYETHGFGMETAASLGVPVVNEKSWEDWPDPGPVDLVYGNPRCTGFSTITSGYGEETHGPWAKQTADVHDLCNFAVRHKVPYVIWESVQQAFTVGRPLLDYLRDELFVPAGYRIAHLFLNAAGFGNAQNRRRYFFAAYPADAIFDVLAPVLEPSHTTMADVIGHLRNRETHEKRLYAKDVYYTADCHTSLTPDEWAVVPHLPQGCCLNRFAREYPERLRELSPKFGETWDVRISDMPFSLHCVARPRWHGPCPTLHNSCGRLIHPLRNRPLTVGELAALMGWGKVIPRGRDPVSQIAKGVVPAAGQWLAEQVAASMAGRWDDDWETRYDDRTGLWNGTYLKDKPPEKRIDMTRYFPGLAKEI